MTFTDNPSDWYFTIANDQTQVYSTARGIFVPVADTAFVAWSSGGNVPTNLDSINGLGIALSNFLLRPTDATALDAYTGVQADKVITHLLFKIVFNHENRVRAIERQLALNGSPPNLTANQARAAVKALM